MGFSIEQLLYLVVFPILIIFIFSVLASRLSKLFIPQNLKSNSSQLNPINSSDQITPDHITPPQPSSSSLSHHSKQNNESLPVNPSFAPQPQAETLEPLEPHEPLNDNTHASDALPPSDSFEDEDSYFQSSYDNLDDVIDEVRLLNRARLEDQQADKLVYSERQEDEGEGPEYPEENIHQEESNTEHFTINNLTQITNQLAQTIIKQESIDSMIEGCISLNELLDQIIEDRDAVVTPVINVVVQTDLLHRLNDIKNDPKYSQSTLPSQANHLIERMVPMIWSK